MKPTRRAFLAAAASAGAAQPAAPARADLDGAAIARRHPLVAGGATPNFFEGMLLGNGDIGVCITVRADALGLHIGKEDSWDIRVSEDHYQHVLRFSELLDLWRRAGEEAKRQGKPDAALLDAGGSYGTVLALRGHRLDLPVSAAVPGGPAHAAFAMTEHTESDSIRTYTVVFLVLLALTGITTAVAYIDLGHFSVVVALAIAVVKMLLVALFFMHLRHSRQLTKIVVGGGLLWLVILIALSMSDFISRGWLAAGGG